MKLDSKTINALLAAAAGAGLIGNGYQAQRAPDCSQTEQVWSEMLSRSSEQWHEQVSNNADRCERQLRECRP